MTDTTYPDRSREDDFLWLEDIYGDEALRWVEAHNAQTMQEFDQEALDRSIESVLEVLDSDDRLPLVDKHGDYLYNFWRDAEHPKGIWRRTTLDSYRTDAPEWETILDIDALAEQDGVDWVWHGADFLYPDGDLVLTSLSPDGGDASEIREFDLTSREFVDGGFHIPTAKGQSTWIDRDTLLVTSDFGPGTVTSSSYPRQARRWKRGEDLADAEVLLEIPEDHMGMWAGYDPTPGFERIVLIERVDFFHGKTYVVGDDGSVLIDVPDDADPELHREWLTLLLRSDWTVGDSTYAEGQLIAIKLDDFLAGDRNFEIVFEPDAQTSLIAHSWTRDHLLLTLLRDVQSTVAVLSPGEDGWSRTDLGSLSPNETVTVSAVDEIDSNDYWQIETGFLKPTQLSLGTVGADSASLLKASGSHFDAEPFEVTQHFATSKDGTRVPYFQIAKKGLELDGKQPTLLTGYGGFLAPILPSYSGAMGRIWLERGGVLLSANIRGGSEYGPGWHRAALRENRHRAYEDFAAIAEDAIARGVTSPSCLGCTGRSNGGLLVGNMLTHFPHLFGAIFCGVPLLDMKRYTKLSAGYSWIAEYGDPEKPEEWEFIQTFSPYHNLRDGVDYPPILIYTATSDDRVGPHQARKMAARMEQRGINGMAFYENRLGGHAGSSGNREAAFMLAMSIEFMWKHLCQKR